MKRKICRLIVFLLCILGVVLFNLQFPAFSQAGTVEAGSSGYPAPQEKQSDQGQKTFLPLIIGGASSSGTTEYALTINIVGKGAVSKAPNKTTYHSGDVVTLTAVPDPGWGLGSWSANVVAGQVTILGDTTVTATFLQDGFTLTVTKVGNGTVTKSPDQATYHYGDSVILTATPDQGWNFLGWSGDVISTQNPQTVTMTGSKSITATFSNLSLSGYFVATTGNDANPGTQSKPWQTIGKAARTVTAGDTVYVRGGVYNEQVKIAKSGTQASPIRFLAYPGETPVIEGSSLSISQGSSLLELSGNWIDLSGFEVRNSKALSVELSGQHNVVDNVFSHHSIEQGILARGDYSTVQNCRVWRTALNNENGAMSGGGWASALSAARDNVDGTTDYAVLRNNISWENWGEGVSSFEANGTLIEGNIAYDNYSANIYVSDTTNALVQGNLVYMTSPITYMTKGSRVGIEMGDEVHKPSSANNTIINNIAYGNTWNFFWWAGRQGDGLVNVLIANNTFVNSTNNPNVEINSGSHQGSQFVDNIIVQDGSAPIAEIASSSGLTVKNNLWSKKPSGPANGTGDVIGDPKLAKTGSAYAANWYRLLDGSPAIDKALPLPLVTKDFAGAPRGSAPDIGAFEK